MGQGMKEKKYQVFVSSTYEDLKEERAAVSQTLLDLGCIPVGMEQFPASGMSQMEYIKKMLETCDYYILILAGRYGSIDPTDGIGYTEKEYDYAVANGKPVMSFVVEEIGKLPSEKCEKTDAGRDALMKFRDKVLASRMIKKYSSKESLQAGVAVSLQKCIRDFPAVGWVRADGIDTNPSLEIMMDKYMKEHPATIEEIDALLDKKLDQIGQPPMDTAPISMEEIDAIFNEKTVEVDIPNKAGGKTAIIGKLKDINSAIEHELSEI